MSLLRHGKNYWVQHSVGNIPWASLSAFFSAWRKVVTVMIFSGWASSVGEIRIATGQCKLPSDCQEIAWNYRCSGQHRQHSVEVSQWTTKSAGSRITANKNPTIDWDPSPRFAAHLGSGIFVLGAHLQGAWWTSYTLSRSSNFNHFPYFTACSFIVCFISILDS